jgi:hypothetical protein
VIRDVVLRGLVLRGLRLAAWPLSTPSELSERSFEAALLDLLNQRCTEARLGLSDDGKRLLRRS